MAFQTLERSPPPFFRQGPSAATRLVFYAALALLLMAMDARWHVAAPVRQTIAVLIEPAVELARAPGHGLAALDAHFEALDAAQRDLAAQRRDNLALALQASHVGTVEAENARLRTLLQLRQAVPVQSAAAQIVAQAADPYTRKLFIDRGVLGGVVVGAPVMDRSGLLGQVTQADAIGAQVTLITDRDSAVPVEVVRNARRGMLVGGSGADPDSLELLWQAADTDLRAGDELVTSGLDGIYPAGLAVARIASVQRQADSAFARVLCVPLAQVDGGHDVLVLKPLSQLAVPPVAASAAARTRRGRH
jgi:rod shape-determining protein MreC